MAKWKIFEWFKKEKQNKWEPTMDSTPRHGRRVKTTKRKGVAIYEKARSPEEDVKKKPPKKTAGKK